MRRGNKGAGFTIDHELFYTLDMTELLERAFEAARRLPPERQDEVARAILYLAKRGGAPEEIASGDLTAVLEALAQANQGEFATDAEIEAAFRRFER